MALGLVSGTVCLVDLAFVAKRSHGRRGRLAVFFAEDQDRLEAALGGPYCCELLGELLHHRHHGGIRRVRPHIAQHRHGLLAQLLQGNGCHGKLVASLAAEQPGFFLRFLDTCKRSAHHPLCPTRLYGGPGAKFCQKHAKNM